MTTDTVTTRLLLLSLLIIGMTGCSLVASEDDEIRVRVRNETEETFTKVVLDLGTTETGRAIFRDVPPAATTRFGVVREAFLQPYTVRAHTPDREYVFDLVAAAAVRLDPGHHTYSLTLDEEDNLIVNRGR